MAAPVPGTRTKPTGRPLYRGYRHVVGIGLNPTIKLYEKATKPSGFDGGAPIDITTQWNDLWRTHAPEALITLMPTTIKASFSTLVFDQLTAIINKETTGTHFFADTSKYTWFGSVQKIEIDEQHEKDQPTMTVTIQPNMIDSSGVEQAPVYTAATGT